MAFILYFAALFLIACGISATIDVWESKRAWRKFASTRTGYVCRCGRPETYEDDYQFHWVRAHALLGQKTPPLKICPDCVELERAVRNWPAARHYRREELELKRWLDQSKGLPHI